MPFELTRDYMEQLHAAIEQKDEKGSLQLLDDLHAADIAEIYGELDQDEARFLFRLLDGEMAADVLM